MERLEEAPYWSELLALRDDLSVAELAAKFGTTPVAIVLTFKRLGIAKTARPAAPGSDLPPEKTARPRPAKATRPASSAPAQRPAPAARRSANAGRAWEVRFRGRERPSVLLASDFGAALDAARRRGDVASVVLLGPVL